MTWDWTAFWMCCLGGAMGGAAVGVAQAVATVAWRAWTSRRRAAEIRQIEQAVSREWCETCGQRLDETHPAACEATQ